MTTLNDFKAYFRTVSNAELLRVLGNSEEYQLAAVEAAREEISLRKLSSQELQEARKLLDDQELQKCANREKWKIVETLAKTEGRSLLETLNPIQSELPSVDKKISLLVLVYTGLYLFQAIKNFWIHVAFFHGLSEYPFTTIFYFFPFLLLPVALYSFWRRLRIGWFLFTIYVSLTLVSFLWTFVLTMLWSPSGSVFDELFQPPGIMEIIVPLIFYIGSLYILCKKDIRTVYSISESNVFSTVGITSLMSFFAVYLTT